MDTSLSKPLTGRRVFVYMCLFFGVITAVNAVFITKALQTHTGVVTDKPYERGLNYNDVLAAAEEQKALGWNGQLTLDEQSGIMTYRLLDKDGKAIDGAVVEVMMQRPTQKGYDFSLTLSPQSDGAYTSPVSAPLKGVWQAHLRAVSQNQPFHQVFSFIIR